MASTTGIPLLKPFCFVRPGKWSDGFDEHGIFEIVGLSELTSDNPKATIRRIATFKEECKIGETLVVPTHRIKGKGARTDLRCFSEHHLFRPTH